MILDGLSKDLCRRFRLRSTRPSDVIGTMVILDLSLASISKALAIHGTFGAFVAGVALAPNVKERSHAHEAIHGFVIGFFAPVYFVSVGLKTDFIKYFDPTLILVVVFVASVAKIGGATFGAWLGKLLFREALAVGFGMNTREAMELILASLALERGLIEQPVFVALVVMALLTTVLSGPLMHRLLKSNPKSIVAAS